MPNNHTFLFVVCLTVGMIASTHGELNVANFKKTYSMPNAPTSELLGVTYPAIFLTPEGLNLPDSVSSFLTEYRSKVDDRMHHVLFQGVPASSPWLAPGGSLDGLQHGDMILDQSAMGPSGPIDTLFASQVSTETFNVLEAFDGDRGLGNGVTYGVPMVYSAYVLAFHYGLPHADHDTAMEPMDTTGFMDFPVEFKFTTTTTKPDFGIGYMQAGTLPAPRNPVYSWMSLPFSEQLNGHSVTAINLPSAISCETEGAVNCVSCCANSMPLDVFDSSFSNRLASKGLDHVHIIRAFYHAHGKQRKLEAHTLSLDGSRTLIGGCEGCGHGTSNPGASHVLETPIRFNQGDGFEMYCEYNAKHDSSTLEGGLKTEEEMCIGFFQYAFTLTDAPVYPGYTFMYPGVCDAIANEGTDIETTLIPYFHLPGQVCSVPPCFDLTCVV